MNVASPPRDLELAQLEALERMRPVGKPVGGMIGLAVMIALLFLTCRHDGATWRKVLIGAMGTMALLASALGRTRLAERERIRRLHRLPRSLTVERLLGLFATALVGAVVFATGGFDGPLLPMLVPLCFVVGVLNPPRPMYALALVMLILIWSAALISTFALVPNLMPAIFGGGPNVPQPRVLVLARAGAFTVMVLWAAAASAFVRKLFQGMVSDALDARDEALRNHADHTRTLTTLSGEIAHELKNPLASIKGLATLVGRELTGKPAERLTVLRREVERMEEILDGFLNFSRPLIPLQQELVELREVCESVVEMHEGLALERGVRLQVDLAGGGPVACDRRKIKQVLINLVQNALEASPPGTSVELAARPRAAGGAQIEVRDRGPGVSLQVRAHLFEPGVTTKGSGSGLGLALARGLARQHGGDLALLDRPGGGCLATLSLPGAPP